MKCPNCSTSNGRTNKYCRECGQPLNITPNDVAGSAQAVIQLDELGLREELFEVWQLVEAGEIAPARKIAEKLVEDYPESAAAHSLVALIYERIAERALEQGLESEWRNLIKLAIVHYEDILDLNPDSTADREKLASLRIKLAGRTLGGEKHTSLALPPAIANLWRKVKGLPVPVLAASGAFFLCLIVIFVVTSGARKEPDKTASASTSTLSTPASSGSPYEPANVTGAPTTPVAPPATGPQPPVSYNPNPAPMQQPMAPAMRPPMPVHRSSEILEQPPTEEESITVQPTRIKIPKLDFSVAPVSPPKSDKAQPRSAVEVRKIDNKPSEQPAQPQPKAEVPSAPSGASVLAQAVRYYGQGRSSEAVTAAQQAVAMFESDIASERNVDSAKRGLVNAKKIIAACQ